MKIINSRLTTFQTDQIYKVHSSPKKDCFIMSMNCNLDIQENIKNNVFDEIKELSEKSRLLLEKCPAYQNDIKRVYMWLGVPGRTHGRIYFYSVLSAANINTYSWHYKFYDIEENKIRDCRIYSPYEHFLKRGFIFKNDTFTSGSLCWCKRVHGSSNNQFHVQTLFIQFRQLLPR